MATFAAAVQLMNRMVGQAVWSLRHVSNVNFCDEKRKAGEEPAIRMLSSFRQSDRRSKDNSASRILGQTELQIHLESALVRETERASE